MNRLTTISFIALLIAARAGADEVDFARDIRPILSDACYHCHGPDENTREAELRLDTKDGLFRAADGVTVIIPSKPKQSELIVRLISDDEDERMPPPDAKRQLTAREIDLLKRWVTGGAKWSGHWSFQPIVRPPLAKLDVKDSAEEARLSAWPRGAIDTFVLARLMREKLTPSPEASRERLLRRVTIDLTGLPPTLKEIDAFLADKAPGAYERVIDRLLTSPHYGERMAWEWLDAARYADSNGFQGDNDRTMWPWRDWVVRAINSNMPLDRFAVEQLAGDLLPGATTEQKLATGFCRNHMINGEGGRIPEENRVEYIVDQVETVGTVWLGLTLSCCRCHDHKYDPLLRSEYYQLFDFFNQTPVNGGGGNAQTPPVISAPSLLQQHRLQQLQQTIATAAAAVQAWEATELARLRRSEKKTTPESKQDAALPEKVTKALAVPVEKRSAAQLAEIEKHFVKSAAEYAALLKRLRESGSQRTALQKSFARVMVMQDMSKTRKTYMLTKGLYSQRGEEVKADVPKIFPLLPAGAKKNRLALARWLVDPSHPLSARVIVNRQWQMFFGTGLVRTVDDFGSQGERPSHPALLDWLARELIDSGWDRKALHRRIVTSATYRQSAKASKSLIERDPKNRLLARGPRFRMPSWMIRDHALATSGLLVSQFGGPSVKPYQPKGVWAEATFGKKRYQQDRGEKLYRRTLYTFWRRIVGPTILFDAAKRQTCSVHAARTNTPLHALTTLNGVTYVEAGRVLAQRILLGSDSKPEARLAIAFRLATSRAPTRAEREIMVDRLAVLQKQFAAAPDDARKLLAIGESPRDQTLDTVTHAAYTGLCTMILNLDETISK